MLCDKGPGTWLVTGGQANDRKLDARLDEAAGRRKQSGTRCANCAYRHLSRPGEGTADGAESRRGARNRPGTRRRSKPGDARNRQAGVRRRGNTDEDARAAAAASRPRAQTHASAAVLTSAGSVTASPINGARTLIFGLVSRLTRVTGLRVSAIKDPTAGSRSRPPGKWRNGGGENTVRIPPGK